MVTELTVQQRLDYWARKIGIGSVWVTPNLFLNR